MNVHELRLHVNEVLQTDLSASRKTTVMHNKVLTLLLELDRAYQVDLQSIRFKFNSQLHRFIVSFNQRKDL
jgi:hypothetical protein